ncbi:MAG: hypothetical protein LBE13_00990, partial [Bacteroidales bacterium]|jgi:hypothetical protein|nr:hypothetical protein [Bacteroidales bacterium]
MNELNLLKILSIMLLFSGCFNSEIKYNIVTSSRDVGTVNVEPIEYDFFFESTGHKHVDSVFVGCACTTLDIKKGDDYDFSKPIHVSIHVDKSNYGKGTQEFSIFFSDKTFVVGKLNYNYLPNPSWSPEYLIFFEDIVEQEVEICFPSEKDIETVDISVPLGLTWFNKFSSRSSTIILVFMVDREKFVAEPVGEICVSTNSHKMPKCILPYLILSP